MFLQPTISDDSLRNNVKICSSIYMIRTATTLSRLTSKKCLPFCDNSQIINSPSCYQMKSQHNILFMSQRGFSLPNYSEAVTYNNDLQINNNSSFVCFRHIMIMGGFLFSEK